MIATGFLADYVQDDCRICGALLLVPSRMATEVPGPACGSCEWAEEAKRVHTAIAAYAGERRHNQRGGDNDD